jgi:hypothetical protein
MMVRPHNPIAQARARAATAVAAALMSMMAPVAAWPQGASAPPTPGVQETGPQPPAQQAAPQSEPAPSAPASAHEEHPGLINEMRKVFEKSLSILPPLKSPQETIEDLNARAKDAAKEASEGLSHLATPSSMVSGRMVCPPSPNGAPDCKLGADKLCQSRGLKEGKSLTTDSAETCSAKIFIPGRTRKPGDCRTDTYVTAALCQ